MIKNKRYYVLFAVIAASLLNIFIGAQNVGALKFNGWSSQHILNQAYAQGVYRCYSAKNGDLGGSNYGIWPSGKDSSQITQTIKENPEYEMDGHVFGYRDLFEQMTASYATYLPNGLTPVVGVNCALLINDWRPSVDVSVTADIPFSKSVYVRLGVPSEDIEEVRKGGERKKVDKFMEGMGFTSDEDEMVGVKSACYAIKYRADNIRYEDSTIEYYQEALDGKWNTKVDAEQIVSGSSRAQICATVGDDGKITSLEVAGWQGGPYYQHGGEYFLAYVDQGGTKVRFQIWAWVPDGDHDKCSDGTAGGYNGTCTTQIFPESTCEDDGDDFNPCKDGSFDAKGMTLKEFKKKLESVVTQIRYTEGIGAPESDKKYETRAIAPLCMSGSYPAPCSDPSLFTGTAIGIYVLGVEELVGDAAINRTWTLTGNGNNALKYIYDNSTLDKTKKRAGSSWSTSGISANEKPLLYQWYMANQSIGRVNINCNPTEEELKLHPEWVYTVEWFDDMNTKLTCYVTTYDPTAMVVLADKDGHFNTYLSPITDLFAEMKYAFNTLHDVDPDDIISVEEAQKAYNNSLLGVGNEKENCYTGAGSLGWIICPLIDISSKLIMDKYVDWVEPALQVNTLLFGTGDNSPTYVAWGIFRDIANLAFIIIFLIVILSQVTGVGISNYGVKKILPKLIIGALLINCSYIICQLAIDIANIIGYGIAGVFQWVTNQINAGMPSTIRVEGVVVDPAEETSLKGVLSDGVAGMGLVVVLIVGVLSAASVLSQGTALVIPILLAVLGIAISFFTLIAILGLRQAAAVLLVVASPLAFVCYMLPNTKKIFEKWFKAFQGLLIAFPACSALIYGGDMVGRILLSSSYGSTWITISAAVVSIAPVFFIPKLIRGSMGAIANVMTNASRSLTRSARNAGNNSRIAKDIRANHDWNQQRRLNMRHAGVKYNKETKKFEKRKFGSGLYGIGIGRGVKIARARNAVLSDYQDTELGTRMAGEGGVDLLHSQMYSVQGKLNDAAISATESRIKQGQMTMTVKDEKGKDKEVKIDPSNINQLRDALVQAILKGEDEKQKALVNLLSNKGDKGREAVHEAIEGTEAAADKMNNTEIKRLMAMHRSLASHIMENFAGAYKENNRSTHDWALRAQSGSHEFNTADLEGKKNVIKKRGLTGTSMPVEAVKPETLINMDDQEFERLVKSTAGMEQPDRTKLNEAIAKALNSEATVGAKVERVNKLEELANKLNQTPPPAP